MNCDRSKLGDKNKIDAKQHQFLFYFFYMSYIAEFRIVRKRLASPCWTPCNKKLPPRVAEFHHLRTSTFKMALVGARLSERGRAALRRFGTWLYAQRGWSFSPSS